MPTYSFHCPTGHDFDVFERKISSKMKAKCPKCGKIATRQISGGAGLHFKGSGFYITDYKNSTSKEQGAKSKGEAASKESPKEAKGESTSTPKSDAKPDKATE